jgi:hypothetical protein
MTLREAGGSRAEEGLTAGAPDPDGPKNLFENGLFAQSGTLAM